jgi:hypothetical protein
MFHLFPGFTGIVAAVSLLILMWLVACLTTENATSFDFDALGEKGGFEKLLASYLHLAEFTVGLAAGSIVLLVGSAALHQTGRLPWFYSSPLFLLAASIVYGVLFMVFLIMDYENYQHHPDSTTYTRLKYTRNQALGLGGLACFCVGYVWLIIVVTR